MKAIILITCLLLTALVEADLNQPLVPFAFLLMLLLVLAFIAIDHRRNP